MKLLTTVASAAFFDTQSLPAYYGRLLHMIPAGRASARWPTPRMSEGEVRPLVSIPAILAGTSRGREVSTRNPRSRYGTTDDTRSFRLTVTTGGIGARSGVDTVRSR
jgi:hypothetical protein